MKRFSLIIFVDSQHGKANIKTATKWEGVY